MSLFIKGLRLKIISRTDDYLKVVQTDEVGAKAPNFTSRQTQLIFKGLVWLIIWHYIIELASRPGEFLG